MSANAGQLINDEEFLDDLQQLVNAAPRDIAPGTMAHSPLDAFSALIGADNADHLTERAHSTPGRVAEMWPDEHQRDLHNAARSEDAEPATAPPPSFALKALVVLVCAATGAGMSALVFHDRAALLLNLLTK
jgi:hypothetical protein